jgi:hypothetical protein
MHPHKENTNKQEQNPKQRKNLLPVVNYDLIEKSIKVYKTYHNMRDFDTKFAKGLSLDSEKIDVIKNIV